MIYNFKELNILKVYYFAAIAYLLPFISFFIFIVDQLTVNKTDMIFWVIFLVALMPCAVIGVLLCIVGLLKSFKQKSKLNKIVGAIGLVVGLGGIAAGILSLLLIYVVVSN